MESHLAVITVSAKMLIATGLTGSLHLDLSSKATTHSEVAMQVGTTELAGAWVMWLQMLDKSVVPDHARNPMAAGTSHLLYVAYQQQHIQKWTCT